MSFQDVGTRPLGNRTGPGPGWTRPNPSFGSAASGSSNSYSSSSMSTSNGGSQPPAGGDTIRDLFNQYQQNVTIYERICKSLGTVRDDSELRSQVKAQESVVQVRLISCIRHCHPSSSHCLKR